MIAVSRLEDDLRKARRGDRAAAARVYDQTCKEAWLLARCATGEPEAARRVVLAAYRQVLSARAQTEASIGPRAWVLAVVHAHANSATS